MKRPILFAAELLAALALAAVGTWVTAKAGAKTNAKANADVRSSFALLDLSNTERQRLEIEKRILALYEKKKSENKF